MTWAFGAIGVAQGARPAQLQAIEDSRLIKQKVLAIAGSASATYPTELLDEIADFYDHGSSDEQVAKLFCREWVLALYRDMFYLNREAKDDPSKRNMDNETRLHDRLSRDSAKHFRGQLTELLRTAHEDLEVHQVKKLYYIVQNLLTVKDRDALEILESYATDPKLAPDDRSAAEAAIAKIKEQKPSAE